MKVSEFRRRTEQYGGDIRRWPVLDRAPAWALLDTSPQARALLADAAELDRRLDAGAHAAVTDAAVERVLAALDQRTDEDQQIAADMQPERHLCWGSRAGLPATAGLLVAMGLFGFLAGDPVLYLDSSDRMLTLTSAMSLTPYSPWMP